MKTLKGRPIGLKAIMTEVQMYEHLKKIASQWEQEGFSKQEVFQAITSKVRPLAYGFYWHRYPEAQTKIQRAYAKFSLSYVGKIVERISPAKKTVSKPKPKIDMNNLLAQFNV